MTTDIATLGISINAAGMDAGLRDAKIKLQNFKESATEILKGVTVGAPKNATKAIDEYEKRLKKFGSNGLNVIGQANIGLSKTITDSIQRTKLAQDALAKNAASNHQIMLNSAKMTGNFQIKEAERVAAAQKKISDETRKYQHASMNAHVAAFDKELNSTLRTKGVPVRNATLSSEPARNAYIAIKDNDSIGL
jgi:hypothetical protein